jgi:hypothetical protein
MTLILKEGRSTFHSNSEYCCLSHGPQGQGGPRPTLTVVGSLWIDSLYLGSSLWDFPKEIHYVYTI